MQREDEEWIKGIKEYFELSHFKYIVSATDLLTD